MRKSEVERILKKYGYRQGENPYCFVNFSIGHFASIGAPKDPLSMGEPTYGWTVHIWIKGNYNGTSYYNYQDLVTRLEAWPLFERVK